MYGNSKVNSFLFAFELKIWIQNDGSEFKHLPYFIEFTSQYIQQHKPSAQHISYQITHMLRDQKYWNVSQTDFLLPRRVLRFMVQTIACNSTAI